MKRALLVLVSLGLWPGGANATTQVLIGGGAAPSASAAQSTSLPGTVAWNATDADRKVLAAATGTLSELRVAVATDPDNGAGTQSLAFEVWRNGVATTATCTISDGATTCTDLVNTVSVTAGDQLSLRCTPTATPVVSITRWSLLFVPTTTNQTLLAGGSASANLSTSATNYLYPNAAQAPNATETNVTMVVPTAGTLDNLMAALNSSIASGSYTIALRLNEGSTLLSCVITATTCSDSANSISVVAGDRIAIESTPASPSAARRLYVGLRFTPTTSGAFILAQQSSTAFSTSATHYAIVNGAIASNTVETNRVQLAAACRVTDLYVSLSAAPENGGGTQSYTVTLRTNATTNTALTCTVSEANTTCSSTGQSVSLSTGDRVTSSIVPSGTPTAAFGRISYAATVEDAPIPPSTTRPRMLFIH